MRMHRATAMHSTGQVGEARRALCAAVLLPNAAWFSESATCFFDCRLFSADAILRSKIRLLLDYATCVRD